MTLTGRRRVSRFVAGHEAHQSTTAEELGRAGRDWNWTNNDASRTAELEELVACTVAAADRGSARGGCGYSKTARVVQARLM